MWRAGLCPSGGATYVRSMCGRYASFCPRRGARQIIRYGESAAEYRSVLESRAEPTLTRGAASPRERKRHLDVLHGGLLPYFTKDAKAARRPINARAETVTTSGMYRGAFARRRCLVPAAAFYEWKVIEGGKQPYATARADGEPLALGGIWESWRGEGAKSSALLRSSPSDPTPRWRRCITACRIVVDPKDWPTWLGEVEADPATLLGPPPDGTLRAWPVSRNVNSPRNNSAELLEPAES